jgi:cyclopropane-fatty-acyl-phospholipid synthase
MVINQVDDIGNHYAITLSQWRKNFITNINAIYKLGFDKSFSRMWIFYLCYCEGGFKEKAISDLHIHITKPRYRNKI